MRDIYLDKVALAGGEGRQLLQRIKYEALREFAAKMVGLIGARTAF
jgi:hypothetical protein